jgi:hypothetical protein
VTWLGKNGMAGGGRKWVLRCVQLAGFESTIVIKYGVYGRVAIPAITVLESTEMKQKRFS